MADGLEGLAQAIYPESWEEKPMELYPWQECSSLKQYQCRRMARAALTFLGFVNEAGQVYCPAEGSVGDALRHLREAYVSASSYVDPVEDIEAALRALGEDV